MTFFDSLAVWMMILIALAFAMVMALGLPLLVTFA
jgi:hypothetical protein